MAEVKTRRRGAQAPVFQLALHMWLLLPPLLVLLTRRGRSLCVNG
ncbi:hypothetical protein [Aeromonas bivalvium]